MGDKTGISWTDATWNPVRGCSRVSAGCTKCYAEVQAARIVRMGKGKPTAYDGLVRTVGGEPRWTGEVRLVPEQLAWPLRKKKPLRIFVNSMSDLFHEKLRDEDIAAIFAVMALAAQHTYQILTKRPARMRAFFERWTLERCIEALARHEHGNMVPGGRPHNAPPLREWYGVDSFPLPWVWLGVSVENQDAAGERIPELLRTPAAVRFLSCEPLLGPIDLLPWFDPTGACDCAPGESYCVGGCAKRAAWRGFDTKPDDEVIVDPTIDWIIAGCESGPGARPCSVEWLRALRDQCDAAGVAFFLKQAIETAGPLVRFDTGSSRKPGGVIELSYLDGVQHTAFPGGAT